MTSVLLLGAGAVGARAARQLADTPDVDRVLVADRTAERAEAIASGLGRVGQTVAWDGAFPDGVGAVAIAIPASESEAAARAAIAAGVPVAAVADDEPGISSLLDLDDEARRAGVTVAVGCGLTPGLTDVLARHAANALDSVDEVHVARAGAAGEACVAAVRRMRRERALEWRDNEWHSERPLGPELIWFPDPISARECQLVAPGVGLLRDAVPGVERVTLRVAEPPVRSNAMALLKKKPLDDGWGAARVQVWGWRGQQREALVYGVIERPAVAAGTVLAVTAARLAGLLPAVELAAADPLGALGLGALVEPAPFLAELARRGVKAAAFEGLAVS
jgi:saccharopine dehydrogenase-like NADP-dependent oxidoreductase